jgi:hypothetical protein
MPISANVYRHVFAGAMNGAMTALSPSLQKCPVTGVPRRRSTTTLTAAEFRAYLDERVLPYLGIECALEIPEPDPAKRGPRRRLELARCDELASRGAVRR